MEVTTGLKLGQVVKSKAGRDKDSLLLVIEVVDAEHVLLADGKKRRVSNPKKKKVKHLSVSNVVVEGLEKELSKNTSDAFIRKAIKSISFDS